MFDDLNPDTDSLETNQAFNLFQELECNTSEELRSQRTHFRISIKARVTMQAANTSDLLDFKVKGVTGNISEGGCGLLLPIPARVGDIYRLEFEQAKIDLPMTFARCVRSYLVREDAFESGFRFFAPISLPGNLSGGAAAPREK